MFELPEYVTLAKQINETLTGKVIDVYECRGVPSATIAHRNILGHIEYFTSSLKQLEVL